MVGQIESGGLIQSCGRGFIGNIYCLRDCLRALTLHIIDPFRRTTYSNESHSLAHRFAAQTVEGSLVTATCVFCVEGPQSGDKGK